MAEKCKQLFISSLTGRRDNLENIQITEEDLEFLKTKREIKDFKRGLKVPGKLLPKRIPGGVVLVDSTYEMR